MDESAEGNEEIAEQVRRVLHDEYKDARHVELETAESIASRVMGWAKLFGFFAGIPLVLIALWLTALGYKSITDFRKLEEKISVLDKDVENKRTQLAKQINVLEKDVENKRTQLAKLKELDTIEQQLDGLSTRVASLESVKFTGTAKIGADAEHRINDVLKRFQQYFAALGFHFEPNQEIHAQIETSESMKPRGAIAYYDPKTNAMVVDEKYVSSDDVVLREYAHRILLRTNGNSMLMGDNNLMGLESGLADYFSRSFADSAEYPSMPGRTLKNDKKLFPARDYADVQEIGLAWGALGWNLRTKLRRDSADKLLWVAWQNAQMKAATVASDFSRALVNADISLNHGANLELIRAELAKRGVH